MRTNGCSPTFTPRPMLRCLRAHSVILRRRHCRRIADVHRRSESPHRRRGCSTVARRGAEEHQRAAAAPGQPMFDWRELQRWGIPESRLPPGSVVRYRAPSLWSAYRGTVLGAVGVLAVQSLLIVGLLYQRRARQRAEIDSRRNLALAADASSPRDDVGADQLDWTRARSAAQFDPAERPCAADDGRRQSRDVRHDRGDPVRHPDPGRPRRRRSSIDTGRCCAVISWTRNRSICTPSSTKAWPWSRTT